MNKHAPDVVQFLSQHDQFEFQRYEHIFSTRFIAEARRRSNILIEHFSQPVSEYNPWTLKKGTFQSIFRHIPYWSGIEWDNTKYWQSIPFCDKIALRKNPDEFINPHMETELFWYRETSGTTGSPLRILYCPVFSTAESYCKIDVLLAMVGLKIGFLQPNHIKTLAVIDNQYATEFVKAEPDGRSGLSIRLLFNESNNNAPRQLLQQIRTHRPQVITLKPNILDVILADIKNEIIHLPNETKVIFSGGANLAAETRSQAETAFGIPVIDVYGMTETGTLAMECSHRDGFHLFEHENIYEVLLEDGSLAFEGSGELVVSTIQNEAMPLLRYRTGDLVKIENAPCLCGTPGRRIRRLSGRLFPTFTLLNGSHFSPTRINRLFDKFPIKEFQFTQISRHQFDLQIEPESGENVAHLIDDIRTYVQALLGSNTCLSIRSNKLNTQEKFERYRTFL